MSSAQILAIASLVTAIAAALHSFGVGRALAKHRTRHPGRTGALSRINGSPSSTPEPKP